MNIGECYYVWSLNLACAHYDRPCLVYGCFGVSTTGRYDVPYSCLGFRWMLTDCRGHYHYFILCVVTSGFGCSHATHGMCLILFSVLLLTICALGIQIECHIEAAVFLGAQRCVPTRHNTIHSVPIHITLTAACSVGMYDVHITWGAQYIWW
jgi:hypothetical protein